MTKLAASDRTVTLSGECMDDLLSRLACLELAFGLENDPKKTAPSATPVKTETLDDETNPPSSSATASTNDGVEPPTVTCPKCSHSFAVPVQLLTECHSDTYYAVIAGKKVGVFKDWASEAAPLVMKVPGAIFKKYSSREAAAAAFNAAAINGKINIIP